MKLYRRQNQTLGYVMIQKAKHAKLRVKTVTGPYFSFESEDLTKKELAVGSGRRYCRGTRERIACDRQMAAKNSGTPSAKGSLFSEQSEDDICFLPRPGQISAIQSALNKGWTQ